MRYLSIAALLLAAGCSDATDGTVRMVWTGGDTGAATLATTARRCGGALELFATAGDTGFALLLDPGAGGLAGEYPVTAGPPAGRGARVAARWTDSLQVAGYRATAGTVTLSGDDTLLSGMVAVAAADSVSGRAVRLGAELRRIVVTGCDSTGTAVL